METRSTNDRVTIEEREDGTRKIVGYGAVFYRAGDRGTEYELWSDTVEHVGRNAFDNAIKQDDVRGLFNHDPSVVLGRTTAGTMRLSVDERGLRYEVDLPDTTAAKDVAASIKRGDITGSSFSFSVVKESWQQGKERTIRTLEELRLHDVGPVTFPAYESSTTGLRAIGETSEAEAKHKQWQAVQVKMRLIDLDQ